MPLSAEDVDPNGVLTPEEMRQMAQDDDLAAVRKGVPASAVIPAGEYRKTEQDKAIDKDLLASGHSQEEVNDPYGIRGGKPLHDDAVPSTPAGDESAGLKNARPPQPTLEQKKRLLAKLTGGGHSSPPTDRDAAGNRIEPKQDDAPGVGGSGPAAPSGPSLDDTLAKDRAALAAAQKDKDAKIRDAQGSNMIWRGLATASHLAPNEAAEKVRLEQAGAPVSNLLEQRKADEANVKMLGDKDALQQTLATHDPNSDLSKRAAQLAVASGMIKPSQAKGFTADQWTMMHQGATYEQSKAQHEENLRRLDAAQKETVRHNHAEEGIQSEKAAKEKSQGNARTAATISKGLASLSAAREATAAQARDATNTSGLEGLAANVLPEAVAGFVVPHATALKGAGHVLTGTSASALEGGGAPTDARMKTTAPLEINAGMSNDRIRENAAALDRQYQEKEDDLRREAQDAGIRVGGRRVYGTVNGRSASVPETQLEEAIKLHGFKPNAR